MGQEYISVWDAIEDDPIKAANLRLRSQLMMEVSEFVKQSGLTQAEAVQKLGTTQPRLGDVMQGKIEKCTVDRLTNMLAAIGYTVNLNVSHTAWLLPDFSPKAYFWLNWVRSKGQSYRIRRIKYPIKVAL